LHHPDTSKIRGINGLDLTILQLGAITKDIELRPHGMFDTHPTRSPTLYLTPGTERFAHELA
jgi:hypothetical protein